MHRWGPCAKKLNVNKCFKNPVATHTFCWRQRFVPDGAVQLSRLLIPAFLPQDFQRP
jgi:hypothetical protein